MSGWAMSQPLTWNSLQEFVAAVQALAGRQRAGDLLPDRAPGLEILRTDRLLEEQRIVGRQRVAKLDSLPWLEELGVGVEGEIEMCRRDFPQSAEIVGAGAHDLAPPLGMEVDAVGAELEGGKPVLSRSARLTVSSAIGRIRRGVDAEINADAVAHFAAQQAIHRHVERLGGDIPKAVVDR